MSKKTLNILDQRINLTVRDNRGQPITITIETNSLKEAIPALNQFVRSFEDRGPNQVKPGVQPQDSDLSEPRLSETHITGSPDILELSKVERLKLLIRSTYKYGWFSAKDILSLYQEYLGEISSSTVSTYLSRLCEEEVLSKRGSRRDLEYMLQPEQLENIPEYKFTKGQNNELMVRRIE